MRILLQSEVQMQGRGKSTLIGGLHACVKLLTSTRHSKVKTEERKNKKIVLKQSKSIRLADIYRKKHFALLEMTFPKLHRTERNFARSQSCTDDVQKRLQMFSVREWGALK